MTAAELPAALLRRRNGGRFDLTQHFASYRPRTFAGRCARAFARRRVDRVVAISQFVAEALGEETVVVYNGTAPSAADRRSRSKTVVVMQRLEAEKDTGTALRAWAAANLGEEGWRLLIYGRGSQLESLTTLAAELGIEGSVEFGGFCDEPRQVLADAGIFLATASAEPFGLAVVEAMAEGAAVIAARGGAHVETLGLDAPMFDPGDWAQCAELLLAFSKDPGTRSEWGKHLQKRQRELLQLSGTLTRSRRSTNHDTAHAHRRTQQHRRSFEYRNVGQVARVRGPQPRLASHGCLS